MSMLLSQSVVILLLLWRTHANPSPWRNVNGSFLIPDIGGPILEPREDNDDPDNYGELSSITKLAAIGDSYSAGIGAGDRLSGLGGFLDWSSQSDWSCSRYDHSYPVLVNTDSRLGDPSKRKFQFKSCSGAVTSDVLNIQIPSLDSGQNAIMLSIGGNDVELKNILNQCIFQWAVLNQEQVLVAKTAALLDKQYKWAQDWDWDALGRGCDGQLDHSKDLIEGDAFSKAIDSVIEAGKKKLADGGMMYVTGYAKFWDEDYSAECDKVTWTTWLYKAENVFQKEENLGSAHRRTMNDLVDNVNSKLKAAVGRAGKQVQFVDYDTYTGHWGGRYCNPGVDESTVESNSRPRLMFYELNTLDPFGTNPWKRSTEDGLAGTFEGDLDIFAQITELMDPNVRFKVEEIYDNTSSNLAMAVYEPKRPGIVALDLPTVALPDQVPSILPDGYGRVFHPQILLHKIIANMIVWQMINVQQAQNNEQGYPQILTLDSCPIKKNPDNPLTKVAECEPPLANFERTTWNDVVDKFCEDHSDMRTSYNVQYGQDDVDDPELRKWDVFVSWDAAKDTSKCSHSCKTIFGQAFGSTSCAYDSHTRAQSGSLDVDDCGKASFALKGNGPAATEEKVFDIQCNNEDDYDGHPDVHENFVDDLAKSMCGIFATHNIEKDNAATYPYWQNAEYFGNRGLYSMRAVWKDGCVLPNDKTSVSAQNPLPSGAPGADESCYDLFFNNWRKCYNGGVGGSTQVGCIVYDFTPSWRNLDFCCR